jgi:hypothetical protein
MPQYTAGLKKHADSIEAFATRDNGFLLLTVKAV